MKIWKSGDLTVATATTFSTANKHVNTSGECITDLADGEIQKIVMNFTSSDTNAVLTVATRDTPADTILELTNWSSDATVYPLTEGKTYQNGTAAANNKTNVFVKFAVSGSLKITCSAATVADTVDVMVYWR